MWTHRARDRLSLDGCFHDLDHRPDKRTGRSCAVDTWTEQETLTVSGSPIWINLTPLFSELDEYQKVLLVVVPYTDCAQRHQVFVDIECLHKDSY